MADATETPGSLATDLGEPRPKKKLDLSTGLARIDVNDRDQVFDLATELMTANKLRLMQVTLAEWQAIARLAVIAAPIMTHAIAAVEAPTPADAKAALRALATITLTMMEAAHAH